MNNQPRIPDPETRARSVARMREICQMFDAQIMVLDELIAEVEAQNRNNPINVRQREKGKRLIASMMEEKSKEI